MRMCRICLDSSRESSYIEIFDSPTKPTIDEKIRIISGIKIAKNDGSPEIICSDCSETLDNFLEFKSQIVKSNDYFQKNRLNETALKVNNEENKTTDTSNKYPEDYGEIIVEESTADTCATSTNSDLNNEQSNNTIQLIIESSEESDQEDCFEILNVDEPLSVASVDDSTTVSAETENDNLQTEMVVGTKRYVCGLCKARFYSEQYLRLHLKVHNPNPNPKPFFCDICKKCFVDSKNLRDHLYTHSYETKFVCELCGRVFLRNSYLKTHLKLHAKYRGVNVCVICKKEFLRNYQLKAHIKEEHCGQRVIEQRLTEDLDSMGSTKFVQNQTSSPHFTVSLL